MTHWRGFRPVFTRVHVVYSVRVEYLGEGVPRIAIIGGIHGDEPSGADAVSRLIEDDPPVEKPVKLIIANEEALSQGVRFIDTDLNRAFGESPDESAHEYELARELAREIEGCLTLSLHSTQSHEEPFGIVNELSDELQRVCPYLSIVALVLVDGQDGRLFASNSSLIEVEAGYQESEIARENAYRIAREFLTATGVLHGWTVGRELPIFRMGDRLPKPAASTYEVLARNFEEVPAGTVYAKADDEEFVAEEPFSPILLSANGYQNQFGYKGDRVGVLQPPAESTKQLQEQE